MANGIEVWDDTMGAETPCTGSTCGKNLMWAQIVKSGARMCFNADAQPLHTRIDEQTGRTIAVMRFSDNHWAHCPDAKNFKRGTRANDPPPPPAIPGLLGDPAPPFETPGEGPHHHGETYDRKRDHVRLNAQTLAVWRVMIDGQWHTLRQVSDATGAPEASVSARFRDLRKAEFGGHTIEREPVEGSDGLHVYRLIPNPLSGDPLKEQASGD